MPPSSSSTRKSGAGTTKKTAARKPAKKTKSEKKPVGSAAAPATAEPTSVTEAAADLAPGARRPRRNIFLDVENTSSEEALYGALGQLKIDRAAADVDLVAVGNWRVIGAHVARMLAQRGARLLHSAPATGVKDWSDLAIAVQAGICLGRAQPGDSIAIVSADRAFDAVADAAATLGVEFRRLTYGVSSGAAERIERAEPAPASRRRRRGGRGRRPEPMPSTGWSPPSVSVPRPAAASSGRASAAAATGEAEETRDIQGATPEHIFSTVARLSARAPSRGVNLDLLINALKEEGYGRPAGSPRLVTRLRMMKDIEVSPTGMVRLVNWQSASGGVVTTTARSNGAVEAPVSSASAATDETRGEADAGSAAEPDATKSEAAKRRRRGTRGGRGRRRKPAGGSEKGPEPSRETSSSS